MSDHDSLMRVFCQVAQLAHNLYPGFRMSKIVIDLADGTQATFPVPPQCLLAMKITPLESLEQRVVDALEGMEGEACPTAEELAELLGLSMTGTFRTCLARMVRNGVLENFRPGYAIAGRKSKS